MLKFCKLIIFNFYVVTIFAQGDIFELQNCKGRPLFLDTLTKCKGYGKPMVFSTGLKFKQGLFYTNNLNIASDICYYQHPTWVIGGTLGKFIIEPYGDIYCVPVPYINTYYNEYRKQNILYKVESSTAIMNEALHLPNSDQISNSNPFGLMGLTFDCSSNSLYISTLAGSIDGKQKGKIYRIQISIPEEQLSVVDSIENINALSLAVCKINGIRRLLYGDADNGIVNSILLNKNGDFTKDIRPEIFLNDEKFLSSHKAVNLKFVSDHVLEIEGAYFDYTLSIPGSIEKNVYTYHWSGKIQKWILENVSFSK